MSGLLFVVLLLGAVAGAEAVYYFVRYLGERPAEELRRRLRSVGNSNVDLQLLRHRRLGQSAWMNDLLSGIGAAEWLERLLEQTDSRMSVPSLVFRMIALALLGAGVPVVLHRPLAAVVFAPLLGASPLLWALRARAVRTQKISEQLPDTLDMMARAITAGHALPAAFKLIAQECAPPVAVEFAKVYEQQNLGLSLEAAVHSMTERVPGCLDLKLLAVSIKIQSETGGNLVEVLEKIADTIRERFKFYSRLNVLTAEGRLSGIILGSLPIAVALLLSITNPAYLHELDHGVGRTILIGGMCLWAVGALWLRQLGKVSY
jgi:tight adherence protein B